MKKIAALILICALFTVSAQAASWPDGRSAGKPYEGTSEIDLDTTMGYILLYPRADLMPAQHFCDTLTIYLPRENIKLAQGTARLYKDKTEIASFDFTDSQHVHLRRLTQEELERLMWGSGACVEFYLDVSLTMGETYYMLMDEGCFTTSDGALKSLTITSPDVWRVSVEGAYGVNGLYYTPAAGDGAKPTYHVNPEVGDEIHFDLVMGGRATMAVIYSNNDSVSFETRTFTESCTVTGTVALDDLRWGIVFLNEAGEPIDVVRMGD